VLEIIHALFSLTLAEPTKLASSAYARQNRRAVSIRLFGRGFEAGFQSSRYKLWNLTDVSPQINPVN
jgi:hypothetical protein